MTTRWKTCVAVLRTLATYRVTYRFLGLLLFTLGAAPGSPLVESFGDVVCVLLGGCDGAVAVGLAGLLRVGKGLHHPHTVSGG